MTESPSRYDVTITVDRDGGGLPDPAEFAVAAAPDPARPAVPPAHHASPAASSDATQSLTPEALPRFCEYLVLARRIRTYRYGQTGHKGHRVY
jgi:hypothetical protein